jgi:CSLREA domain-containing protein
MIRTTFCKSAILIIGLLLAAALGPASLAQSTQILVDSTADAVDVTPGDGQCRTAGGGCTLRAAVQEANALAGEDVIRLAAATYTITISGGDDAAATGDLDITSNMSIIGAGSNATIIDGNQINRVFEIWNSSTQVTISQLTIQNGQAQAGQSGGGLFNKGQAKLENVIVTGNQAENGAGVSSSSSLLIVGSTISGNVVFDFGGSGGGIYSDGALTVNDSVLSDNHAFEDGGGIYHIGSLLTINGSAIRDNVAEDGSGGGIVSSGTVTVDNSSVSDNIANTDIDGGGGINSGSGKLTITGSTINGNTTIGFGGGIRNNSAMVIVRNSTFSGNSAT